MKRSADDAELGAEGDTTLHAKLPLATVLARLRPYFEAAPHCFFDAARAKADGGADWGACMPPDVSTLGDDWPKHVLVLPDGLPRWMTDERLCAFTGLRHLVIHLKETVAPLTLSDPIRAGALDHVERLEFVDDDCLELQESVMNRLADPDDTWLPDNVRACLTDGVLAQLPDDARRFMSRGRAMKIKTLVCDLAGIRGACLITGLCSWFARIPAASKCDWWSRYALPVASAFTLREIVMFSADRYDYRHGHLVDVLIRNSAHTLERLVIGAPITDLLDRIRHSGCVFPVLGELGCLCKCNNPECRVVDETVAADVFTEYAYENTYAETRRIDDKGSCGFETRLFTQGANDETLCVRLDATGALSIISGVGATVNVPPYGRAKNWAIANVTMGNDRRVEIFSSGEMRIVSADKSIRQLVGPLLRATTPALHTRSFYHAFSSESLLGTIRDPAVHRARVASIARRLVLTEEEEGGDQ